MKSIRGKFIVFLGIVFFLILGSYTAQAAVIVLTFEGLQDNEPINDFYNGGTGGFGSSGPNYGVSFTSDSLGLIDADFGGSGNFSNNPSGVTIMYFLSGADTMNVAAGFDTGFSFFYAAAFDGSVSVYDGLNGTGTLLTTLGLPATNDPYNEWDPIGVSFGGTAMSVVFSGSANFIGFDDVTLGSSVPTVPDTGSTLALLGLALSGIAALKRKLS